MREIHDMLTAYIRMCGGIQHVVNKYCCGKSGRGVLPDIFKNYSLNIRALLGLRHCPLNVGRLEKERMNSILIVHFVYIYVSIGR